MTLRRPSARIERGTPSKRERTFPCNKAHTIYCYAVATFLILVGLATFTSSPVFAAEKSSPALLAEVVGHQAERLVPLDSDEKAVGLFASTIGPALGLKDAAGALGARRLPSQMAKELGVAELSQSVSDLMAALATWQLADALTHDTTTASATISLPAVRQDWLQTRSHVGSLAELARFLPKDQSVDPSQPIPQSRNTDLLLAAHRTAYEASQRATTAWWNIYGWKERIRQARGLARLCGTWQWIIHNHQIHGEQKSTIMFPPPGQVSANATTPAETIILGDAIYLRWEHNGQIQEDSLLFIKDDNKIEGSFMNNTGGWGPVSGKRTAPCQP